jgi:hypothetical protein
MILKDILAFLISTTIISFVTYLPISRIADKVAGNKYQYFSKKLATRLSAIIAVGGGAMYSYVLFIVEKEASTFGSPFSVEALRNISSIGILSLIAMFLFFALMFVVLPTVVVGALVLVTVRSHSKEYKGRLSKKIIYPVIGLLVLMVLPGIFAASNPQPQDDIASYVDFRRKIKTISCGDAACDTGSYMTFYDSNFSVYLGGCNCDPGYDGNNLGQIDPDLKPDEWVQTRLRPTEGKLEVCDDGCYIKR